MAIKILLFMIFAFFLGAVPFGQVIARLHSGVDLKKTGSGNIGATNVARTLGVKLGVMTLILDMGKGLAAVLLAKWIFETEGPAAVAGLAAMLGHVYSPFLRFKGGKGVATALGVYLGLIPLALIPAMLVFALVVAKWGFVSAGSLAGALVAPLSASAMGYGPWAWGLTMAVTVVIFIRHRENIQRLRQGTENKWRRAKEPSV
jgi:glycerol-3-phosphate acyltransferase PlsY